MKIKYSRTERGFEIGKFLGINDQECNIQQSSRIVGFTDEAMNEPGSSAIWLGVANGDRMHLDRETAGDIGRALIHWSETGELIMKEREILEGGDHTTTTVNQPGGIVIPEPTSSEEAMEQGMKAARTMGGTEHSFQEQIDQYEKNKPKVESTEKDDYVWQLETRKDPDFLGAHFHFDLNNPKHWFIARDIKKLLFHSPDFKGMHDSMEQKMIAWMEMQPPLKGTQENVPPCH